MAMDKWERMHRSNLALYQRRIMAIYEAATKEAAAIGASIDRPLGEELFDFSKFPTAQKRIDELMKKMYAQTRTVIVNGVRSEWTLANNKNNELCRMVFGDNVGKLTQAEYRRYFSNNLEARDAFIERKENGLDLSDRVWEYTNMYKNELELGLDVGIRNGRSADELSRDLRDYLQHPDKLFRRVRDEHGMLVLSAAAKAFHPGRGVYRSSYMNARRLAATETNIAYRTADYNRYQQLDFVVGIQVNLSNNHNCKGIPAGQFYDICDELQGKYPKDFKFVGWHPFCRCYVTSILKTEKEMDEDDARIMRGEEPTEGSVNAVTTVPEGFTKWVEDNAARTAMARSIPYFMSDNSAFVSNIFTKKQPSTSLASSQKDIIRYVESMKNRDPRLAAIYSELDSSIGNKTDIELTMLINKYKSIAAKVTYSDLKKWGVVDDSMIMSKLEREFVVQEKAVYKTKGILVNVDGVRRDMIVIKDKYGMEFAIPAGVKEKDVLYKLTEASEAIHSLPRFLRKGIKRVSFYDIKNPLDKYWGIKYNIKGFKSAATDGGFTSFWTPSKGGNFKKIMTHEAGHIFDLKGTNVYKISTSKEWTDAVKSDIKLAKNGKGKVKFYPTPYASTDACEDFAESIMLFINDRKEFKQIAPNRERFLHELTKKHHITP